MKKKAKSENKDAGINIRIEKSIINYLKKKMPIYAIILGIKELDLSKFIRYVIRKGIEKMDEELYCKSIIIRLQEKYTKCDKEKNFMIWNFSYIDEGRQIYKWSF